MDFLFVIVLKINLDKHLFCGIIKSNWRLIMNFEQFKLTCPIIFGSKTTRIEYKKELFKQGQFFKNHTYIFKLLSEREEMILRLRCGMNTGKVVTRAEVGRMLNISGERVRQIEINAFRKLRVPESVEMLMNYTDETFTEDMYQRFDRHFKSLLMEDIIKCIDTNALGIVQDIDIHKLPVEFRYCKSAKNRLYNGGIKTCGQLIDYMKTHSDFKHFGVAMGFYNATTIAICSLIQDGYISINDKDIREDYLEHLTYVQPFQSIRFSNETKISSVPEDLKDVSIEKLGFNTRTINSLKRVKPRINTLEDLVNYYNIHGSFIATIKNLGKGCEKEIMDKLTQLGVIGNNKLNSL